MSNPERDRARLEADRNEVDANIRRFNASRVDQGPLTPLDQTLYKWMVQRRKDLTTQIEEMGDD